MDEQRNPSLKRTRMASEVPQLTLGPGFIPLLTPERFRTSSKGSSKQVSGWVIDRRAHGQAVISRKFLSYYELCCTCVIDGNATRHYRLAEAIREPGKEL